MTREEQDRLLASKDYRRLFDLLIEQHQRQLYAAVRSIVGNHDDSADVLQDAFVNIWKNLKTFNGEAMLFTWAYQICRNQALMFLRKHKRLVDDAIALDAKESYELNQIDGGELLEQLKTVVKGLPEQQAMTFQKKYFEGLKYDQIAEITGLTVGTLKKHYHLAVQKIKGHFSSGSTF